MNAVQSKALINAARNAREALLTLDPDSIVALELWTAIHRAEAVSKPASGEKCVFCDEPDAEINGFSKKLKLRKAHANCAEAYRCRAESFAKWSVTPTIWTDKAGNHEERKALRESLSYCACGGKAENHREDKDGNLLECSHCDSSRQFHYRTDAEQPYQQAA
jgi:hypothetical protein